MNWFLIFMFTGNAAAIIVSLPHEYYVQQKHWATIRCQNRSDDEQSFYSYITNAVWYRDYGNGTQSRIGNSGPAYSSKHQLKFRPPVKKVDEGIYYCCMPNGPCGNSFASRSALMISTPPMLTATSSTHTSFIGKDAVLRCNITDQGVPPAVFSWRKNGYQLTGEYSILIDNTKSLMEIKLMNLTLSDAGVYTCIAEGIHADRSDSVELIVHEKGINNTTTSTTEETTSRVVQLQVLIENMIFPCKSTEPEYIDAALHHHIKQICNCTEFTVSVTLLYCIDNDRAFYTVNLTGPMVDTINIMQLWLDHEMHNPQRIDIGVGVISTCNNSTCSNDPLMLPSSSHSAVPGYLIAILTTMCVIFAVSMEISM